MSKFGLSFLASVSGLLAMSAFGCGGGSSGNENTGRGGGTSTTGGTSSSCSLTDTGDAQSKVESGTFPCAVGYYYDGADVGSLSIDPLPSATSHSYVFLLFHGKPTSITETSPELDTTTQEPNPLDSTKLLTNKTGMECGTPSWGTTAQGHAIVGDNKFNLQIIGEPALAKAYYYNAHGTFHADCAPTSRTAMGTVSMDVTF